jgi:hypothetical protein
MKNLWRHYFQILLENKELSEVKKGEIVVTFRRWLIDNLRDTWELGAYLGESIEFKLQENSNLISWKLEKNIEVLCEVNVYNAITSSDVGPNHKKNWRGKVLAKIKIFYVANDEWSYSNLTKDNLLKRKCKGSPI